MKRFSATPRPHYARVGIAAPFAVGKFGDQNQSASRILCCRIYELGFIELGVYIGSSKTQMNLEANRFYVIEEGGKILKTEAFASMQLENGKPQPRNVRSR